MSDVTFIRGYGFPRGSSMDYAGYGNYAAGPTTSHVRIRNTPDPSVFAPIPALDGIFGDGVDLTVGPLTLDVNPGFVGPAGIGADGLVHYADGSTCDPRSANCPGGPWPTANAAPMLWGLGLLAVGAFLWMNR